MRYLSHGRASCSALVLVMALGAATWLSAQKPSAPTEDGAVRLEGAIQRQLVTGDLAAAIAEYETILQHHGSDRRVAGQARWRMAQAQEQLGRLDQARQNYERILREHADQPALVSASRTRLSALLEDEELFGDGVGRTLVIDTSRSPDSTKMPDGNNRFTVFSDLSIYNPQSGETRRLQTGARSVAYPVVSPDRSQVAYLSWGDDLIEARDAQEQDRRLGRSETELRVANLGSGVDRVLMKGNGARWLRPYVWSPDGSAILTLVERTNGTRQIALVGVADGSVRVLKSLPWLSVQDMSFSGDGKFITYQLATPRGSQQIEFVVMPAGPGAERRYSLTVSPQYGAPPSETDLIVHVLNRTGFGPRPGDIERVRARGIQAYIEEQLHPERVADPVVDAKIADFRSFGMSIPEVLAKAGPPVEIAARRRAGLFERPALIEQAAARRGGDRSAVRINGDPLVVIEDDRPYDNEIETARLIRAVHSERQLQEVLVDFWMNHFSVDHANEVMTVHFEQAIRQHVFGRFEDMLSAVTHHPRMLDYLDNWRSSAPGEVIEKRLAAIMAEGTLDEKLEVLERQPFLKASKGLNENLGRELLELHTVGVDGGYTQKDVIDVARILSGWTIRTRGIVNGREEDGVFMFDPIMHVEGDKVVLGRAFKAGGVDEGEALLRFLSQHPSTARHMSRKLARRFIADDPPQAVVEAASRRFLETNGDLREVVRTILLSPQFRAAETVKAKIKKPLELVASALRATAATFEDREVYLRLIGNRAAVGNMGEKVYTHEAPDGNPDVAGAWMNSNALLVRLTWTNRLATGRVVGVKPDLAAAQALLTQLGMPKPTPMQLEQARAMLRSESTAGAAGGGQNMMMIGASAAATTAAPVDPAALTVGAMLGSPQFQKR